MLTIECLTLHFCPPACRGVKRHRANNKAQRQERKGKPSTQARARKANLNDGAQRNGITHAAEKEAAWYAIFPLPFATPPPLFLSSRSPSVCIQLKMHGHTVGRDCVGGCMFGGSLFYLTQYYLPTRAVLEHILYT